MRFSESDDVNKVTGSHNICIVLNVFKHSRKICVLDSVTRLSDFRKICRNLHCANSCVLSAPRFY